MKLKDWLKKEDLKGYEFARLIGVAPGTVSRYVTASRLPDLRTVEKIHAATNGEVTASDFMFCGAAAAEGIAA